LPERGTPQDLLSSRFSSVWPNDPQRHPLHSLRRFRLPYPILTAEQEKKVRAFREALIKHDKVCFCFTDNKGVTHTCGKDDDDDDHETDGDDEEVSSEELGS